MSDEQKMPEVIYANKGQDCYRQGKWQGCGWAYMPNDFTLIWATPYLRCDIDPDDAVVVKRNVMDKAKDIINNVNPELAATIATLTAERDALVEAVEKAIAAWESHNFDGTPEAVAMERAMGRCEVIITQLQLKEQDDEAI